MTKEEILKAADEAVDMFQYNGEFTDSIRMTEDKAIECAIIHYEKMFELLENLEAKYGKPSSDLSWELDDAHYILTELKLRL